MERYRQSTRNRIIMSQEPLSPEPERERRTEIKVAIGLINNGMRYNRPDMVRKGLYILLRQIPSEEPDLADKRTKFIKKIEEEQRKNDN